MTKTDTGVWETRHPHLIALAICIVASLVLLWPLLTGQILLGGTRSDMFIAGYSFRSFGAQYFLENGSIPQWNPYMFGGLPYIAAMHGDIFYPTAWLRWIMPVDLAITYGMVIHFVLAGWFAYRLVRELGVSFGGGVAAGVMYELSGIVASQMSPGHDGKLFVSALAPLAMWILLLAIRRQRLWAFGAFAIVVALIILGHYQMAYFLFIALGLWAVYLAFFDPERPANGSPINSLGLAAAAMAVGTGITALQVLPFFEYIPFSPRASGGADTGWQFATSFAFPPSEIFTLLLPQFNGVLDHYWGSNPLKFHTEYLGLLPLSLAVFSLGEQTRRRLVVALAAGTLLFMMFSFGGHTPFYRPFFELLPLVKKIRAMGMVFYIPTLFICILAGIGFDRLVARAVTKRAVFIVCVIAGAFALIGVVGGLQNVAEGIAVPGRDDAVLANAPFLRAGSFRLLVFVVLTGAGMWATIAGKLNRRSAIAVLVSVAAIDLWSVDRMFYTFSPRASELFADDAITSHLKQVRPPYRVFDGGSYGYAFLMAYRIPVARGYHSFSLERYSELGGLAEGWRNLATPNLLDLLAIRFLILGDSQAVPGYHAVAATDRNAFGNPAVLYERDSIPAYARVIRSVAKVADAQTVQTILDPRFPPGGLMLVPDTSTLVAPPPTPPYSPSPVPATVTAWSAGHMSVELGGTDSAESHLLISENWYPDWKAEADGHPATVRRADHTLISVDIPPGTREVKLRFDSPTYGRGKVISFVCLLLAFGSIAAPFILEKLRKAA
jgi:hypothetical protein